MHEANCAAGANNRWELLAAGSFLLEHAELAESPAPGSPVAEPTC